MILDGEASETFFHEIFAHTGSGKYIYERESSIFADKIGKVVMPEDISIIADSTAPGFFGSYKYDEESKNSFSGIGCIEELSSRQGQCRNAWT